MNIGHDQGRFMQLLVEMTGARTVVEVGTFTGMSALWLARGLPVDGRLICFDLVDTYVDTAMEAWTEAGVADRIDMRIGPAADGSRGAARRAACRSRVHRRRQDGLPHVPRPAAAAAERTGAILVDNVLWGGAVVDPGDNSPRHGCATRVQRPRGSSATTSMR